jgi:hypothetical protein
VLYKQSWAKKMGAHEMSSTKAKWRADFYDNTEDPFPDRTEIIEASSENEAADIAAEKMGSAMRVDVTRTITRVIT